MKVLQFSAVLFFGLLSSCAGDDEGMRPVAPALVNIEINLSNIQYQNLRQIGGFIYLEGGHRGLIVYHESQAGYRVWDRLCTNEPTDKCGVVEMHSSGFYMEDPCCGSTFDLDGFPTSGPARHALVEYSAFSDGTFLYISN